MNSVLKNKQNKAFSNTSKSSPRTSGENRAEWRDTKSFSSWSKLHSIKFVSHDRIPKIQNTKRHLARYIRIYILFLSLHSRYLHIYKFQNQPLFLSCHTAIFCKVWSAQKKHSGQGSARRKRKSGFPNGGNPYSPCLWLLVLQPSSHIVKSHPCRCTNFKIAVYLFTKLKEKDNVTSHVAN